MEQGMWFIKKLGVRHLLVLCLAIAGVTFFTTTPVSAATNPIVSWGSYGTGNGQFDPAWGIATDSTGNVYVGEDSTAGTIQKFDADGNFESVFVSGSVSHAAGMAFDKTGDLYVADSGKQQVLEFSSSGTLLATIGSAGSGQGQFNDPKGITFDASGNFYVADYGNNRIQKFNSSGVYLTDWAISAPSGIVVGNNGDVYATSTANDLVYKTDSLGNVIATWGGAGTDTGKLESPQGIAISSSGNIYVVDQGNSRIEEYGTDGSYIGQWGSAGTSLGEFSIPQFIAVSSAGYIYTTEYGNSRVQRFSPDIVNASVLPNVPAMLGPSNASSGSSISESAPTFDFTLSAATPESLRYEIQVATTGDFTHVVVDYVSVMNTQGLNTFTIGQAATGDGMYMVGTPSQSLSDGSYFWRVRAIDVLGDQSPFASAPGGFIVDTIAPKAIVLSPSDQAIAVATNSSLTVSFSEPVVAVPSGVVQIYDISDGSTIERIPATSVQVTTAGTSTVGVIPAPNLKNDTSYSVQISPGSFVDLANNATGPIVWSFSTIANPVSAVTTASSSQSPPSTQPKHMPPAVTIQKEPSEAAPAIKGAATRQPSAQSPPTTAALTTSNVQKSSSKPTTLGTFGTLFYFIAAAMILIVGVLFRARTSTAKTS